MSTVNRRKFLRAAGAGSVAAAATTISAPAIAQANPEVTWRMQASWPKSLDTLYGGAEHICRRVSELTEGRFKIQPFAAGEIVGGLQVLDAVQNGTIESGHTALYYYFGKDDTFVFGSALPFGMNARMQHAWMYHGGGNDLMNDFLKTYNVIGWPGGQTNCQMGGWFRKPLKTAEDLKGIKMRLGGFAGKIVQRVGMVPQQIAAGDIYPALEKGTIDGAEWVGPYDDEKLGFVKVAKFYHYPGWWEPNSNSHMICNIEKYNQLPKQYQYALQAASMEATLWVMSKYDAVNAAALKRLVGAGAELSPFTPEIMDTCYKAAQELYAEITAKNPAFKKIYESHMAFQNDGYLWHQITDYTMDSYMIRYRNATKT